MPDVKSYAWSYRLSATVETDETVDVPTPGFKNPENYDTEHAEVVYGDVLDADEYALAWAEDFTSVTVTNLTDEDWQPSADALRHGPRKNRRRRRRWRLVRSPRSARVCARNDDRKTTRHGSPRWKARLRRRRKPDERPDRTQEAARTQEGDPSGARRLDCVRPVHDADPRRAGRRVCVSLPARQAPSRAWRGPRTGRKRGLQTPPDHPSAQTRQDQARLAPVRGLVHWPKPGKIAHLRHVFREIRLGSRSGGARPDREPPFPASFPRSAAQTGLGVAWIGSKPRTEACFSSSGRGSGATGRGADVILLDDPTKDRKEADSPTIREQLWSWYTQVLQTRLMTKAGAIVIIQTRWHEDDLIGRSNRSAEPLLLAKAKPRSGG